VLALAPDASASTRLPCLAYINVSLSTYCKIRYVSKFTAASRDSPCHSTAFLLHRVVGLAESLTVPVHLIELKDFFLEMTCVLEPVYRMDR